MPPSATPGGTGTLRVAAVQFAVGADPEENLATVVRMIDRAGAEGPQVVVLPEFCNHLSVYDDADHAWRLLSWAPGQPDTVAQFFQFPFGPRPWDRGTEFAVAEITFVLCERIAARIRAATSGIMDVNGSLCPSPSAAV